MVATKARGAAGLWLLVSLAVGVPPTPAASAPGEVPAPAPGVDCTVREQRFDGASPSERLRRYDEAGRLLSGSVRLTYDGQGTERLTWEDDRVVLVETTEERPARKGYCDVEGGCDEPPTRIHVRARLRYREGRLVHIVEETERRVEGTPGRWRLAERRTSRTRLEYDAGRPVVVHLSTRPRTRRGPIRFRYQDGRLAQRIFEEGPLRWEQDYRWRDGRLMAVEGMPVSHALAYDDAGRLIRLVTRSGSQGSSSDRTDWTYDSRGQVASRTETRGLPTARPTRTDYTYETEGRLARTSRDGVAVSELTYEGACARVRNAPATPDPLELTQGLPCFTSHGGLYHACF